MSEPKTDERHYFSNGTEGRAWSAQWCDRCTEDHGMHGDQWSEGCPLILSMLVGINEPELLGDNFTEPMTCLRFSRCQCDRGPDDPPGPPPPPPVDPNQGLLFEVTTEMTGVTRGAALDAWPAEVDA